MKKKKKTCVFFFLQRIKNIKIFSKKLWQVIAPSRANPMFFYSHEEGIWQKNLVKLGCTKSKREIHLKFF